MHMALIFRCAVNPDLKERHDQLFCELVESPSCYGGYKELCGFLQKYCKASDLILAAGCALSDCNGQSLIEDFYDAGYHSVVGVDSSESFIASCRERNKEKRPEMQFVVGHVLNVRSMPFQYLLQNTTGNSRTGSPSTFGHYRESQTRCSKNGSGRDFQFLPCPFPPCFLRLMFSSPTPPTPRLSPLP